MKLLYYLYNHGLCSCFSSQIQPIVFFSGFTTNTIVYLHFLLEVNLLSMDSTPSTAKRIKTRAVRKPERLESWFYGKGEQIEKYLHETSRKVINNPKLITFSWLKQHKLMQVRSLLKEQMLKRFLENSGNIYPDLVRVFYTNFQIVGDNLCSHVKGINIKITNDVWTSITGLKYVGLKINKGSISVVPSG